MAVGDQADMQARLQALLPTGWFSKGTVPIRDALVAGLAYLGASIYALIVYLQLQTRISSATDGFLELTALDYFGPQGLVRAANQSDASYRANILAAIVRPRNTRAAIIAVLTQLTGIAPVIFEPWRPADTGGYGTGVMGYGVAGGYGSMLLPGQAFITAYRPDGAGVPNVAGYGVSIGGYGAGAIEYASLAMITGSITDADIYNAINSVRPITRILWVRIQNVAGVAPVNALATESGSGIDTESGIAIGV